MAAAVAGTVVAIIGLGQSQNGGCSCMYCSCYYKDSLKMAAAVACTVVDIIGTV